MSIDHLSPTVELPPDTSSKLDSDLVDDLEAKVRAQEAELERRVVLDEIRRAEGLNPAQVAELSAHLKEQEKLILPTAATTVAVGASLAAVGAVRFGGGLFKKLFQGASGLLTSIERWGDAKLKKHPVMRKVLTFALLPLIAYKYLGVLAAGATGFAGYKLGSKEAAPSWAEQEEADAKKQGAGGGGKRGK